MSGTSLDAIDVALCQRTATGFQQIAGLACNLNEDLRSELLKICREKQIDLLTLGEIEQQFSLACVDAVNSLLQDNSIKAEQICAIGSHGQTIFHSPQGNYPFTLQIGDGNLIVAKTGIPCVTDFRGMDIACGGQGAPLTPAFHQALFAKKAQQRVILNIGGIANITLLNSDNKVLGYDTGPGNMLMDSWIHKTKNKNFDKDAWLAKQGKVLASLLTQLLSEPYFTQSAPKSTGREQFNLNWLQPQLQDQTFTNEDIQRTLLELTAITISEQIQLQSKGCNVFVCGGGALNPLLMQRLQALMPEHKITDTNSLNTDPMFVEAVAFAWLAEQRILEKTVSLKSVTGARQNSILGSVYLPVDNR